VGPGEDKTLGHYDLIYDESRTRVASQVSIAISCIDRYGHTLSASATGPITVVFNNG